MTKYTLYIGLNDKDTKTQRIETMEASKIVQNVLTDTTGGGTIYSATGVYRHDNGTIVIENTLRVELVSVAMEAVRGAIETIKKVLNQESVILQTENVQSVFI